MARPHHAATLDARRNRRKERRSHLLTAVAVAIATIFFAFRLYQGLSAGAVETMGKGSDRVVSFSVEPLAFTFWLAVYLVGMAGCSAFFYFLGRQHFGRSRGHARSPSWSTNFPNR